MASVRKRKWTHNGAEKEAWVVTYTDQGGKRRLKTFDKKKEADAYRTKIEVEIEKGDHVAERASATIKDVCDQFMRNQDRRLRDKLIGNYAYKQTDQIIRLHILPHLGNKIFSALTVSDVENWFSNLVDAGASRASRAHYLNTLRRIEEFAFRRSYVRRKTVRDFKAERGSTDREVIKTFNVDQVGKILQAVNVRSFRQSERIHCQMRAAVYLAAICGLRRGEIFGLTVGAIDLENRVLHIRTSLTAFNELKAPKTRSGLRDVPMPEEVAMILEEWMQKHFLKNDRNLVFTSRSGAQVPFTSEIHRSWVRLLKKAGIQDEGIGYHFHALRHFAASWALEMGMSPPEVASFLGHKTFDMTLQVYAHTVRTSDHRKAAISRNAQALFDATTTRHQPLSL